MPFTFAKNCATCGRLFRTEWRKQVTCGPVCRKQHDASLARARDRKRRARLRAARLGEREHVSDAPV
jgi:hypothetical protein